MFYPSPLQYFAQVAYNYWYLRCLFVSQNLMHRPHNAVIYIIINLWVVCIVCYLHVLPVSMFSDVWVIYGFEQWVCMLIIFCMASAHFKPILRLIYWYVVVLGVIGYMTSNNNNSLVLPWRHWYVLPVLHEAGLRRRDCWGQSVDVVLSLLWQGTEPSTIKARYSQHWNAPCTVWQHKANVLNFSKLTFQHGVKLKEQCVSFIWPCIGAKVAIYWVEGSIGL